ncbi:hypothetical protein WICMUC_002357 [Wickerhamomyces mucosus]|uniref:Mediator of RNA polymerase II transcription subunit 20 n=1 Tax=Wickerhamomyces mucosus TaxID=1378264 RepID=A0A9P8PQY6_9ASCO|nr:hypothetical protein WICMUC_002357 [Wickerhamomyces mucosus]
MISTGVLAVHNASPNSLSVFHDAIISEIPKLSGRWSFELKVFRSNNAHLASTQSSFLFNINFDHEPSKSITLINKISITTSTSPSKELIDSGSLVGSCDPLDLIVQSKLQSLWLVRQTLKVDNGFTYEINQGEFLLRAVNVYLNGSFKNFLIFIEYHGNEKAKESGLEKIKESIARFRIPPGNLHTEQLTETKEYLSDLAYQTVQALQF